MPKRQGRPNERLGNDEPDIEAQSFRTDVEDEPQSPRERREPGSAFGVYLRELTNTLVASAFQKAVQKQVSAVVSQAVEEAVTEALDDKLLYDLRIRVQTTATDAVEQQLAAIDDEPEPEEMEPELYYGSVDEFVREYLTGAYRRRLSPGHWAWSAKWWEYDEAVIRFDAFWRAWEKLRQDPSAGMSVWWRDHADHDMSVLFSSEGPFAGVKMDPSSTEKRRPIAVHCATRRSVP